MTSLLTILLVIIIAPVILLTMCLLAFVSNGWIPCLIMWGLAGLIAYRILSRMRFGRGFDHEHKG